MKWQSFDHPTRTKGAGDVDWNEESQHRKDAAEPRRRLEEPVLEDAASEAERELARRLMGDESEERDPAEEAVAKLPPRWEVRIQTERDPVAEETALYRRMAKEVDGRYGGEDD